jgi:peptide deformylase
LIREILVWPHPSLKKKCEPVTEFNDELRTLLSDMEETMLAARGAGLAANQVGQPIRALVLLTRDADKKPKILKLVNPTIVSRTGVQRGKEGCLSLPGHFEELSRFEWVKVRAQDENGEAIEVEGDGYLSRALQHEMDHLDGVVFVDHLSNLKKNIALQKFQKAKAKGMRYQVAEPQLPERP